MFSKAHTPGSIPVYEPAHVLSYDARLDESSDRSCVPTQAQHHQTVYAEGTCPRLSDVVHEVKIHQPGRDMTLRAGEDRDWCGMIQPKPSSREMPFLLTVIGRINMT